MIKYDFDKIIDRKNTDSIKFDLIAKNGYPEDTIPLWVADMDFAAPGPIVDAIRDACDHGIFGYSDAGEDYFDAVRSWFSNRFNWIPKSDWLVKTPGIVFALSIAVQAFTNVNDSIIIQPPVYYPFFNVIRNNDRNIVENPLILDPEAGYIIDFDDFEKKIADNDVKMFILCSPHNPVGRVWSESELKRLAEICDRYNVIIVADEIHCDITAPGITHTMMLKACSEYSDRIISCTAPSKTFNLAGLQVSNIWIPSEELRSKYNKTLAKTGYFNLNRIGMIACRAAYQNGGEWFDQCRDYIYENYRFMKEYIENNIPQLKVMDIQGTYLAWVDFSKLGLTPDETKDLVLNKARLWLDEGSMFGTGGESYQRFVLACPRKTLEEAMVRLKEAIN